MAERRFKTIQGGRRQQNKQEGYFDYSLLFTILFLLVFGLIMVYSSSSYKAALEEGSSAFYFKKQLRADLIGLVAMIVAAFIPYHLWEKVSWLGYIVGGALILMIIPWGKTINGARRWLYLGPVSFQPVEACKLALIILEAALLCKIGRGIKTWRALVVLAVPAVIYAGMVAIITKNVSSAIILCGIFAVMVFVASPDYKRYLILIFMAAIVVAGYVYWVVSQTTTDGIGFRGERILAWLNPEKYADKKGFQTLQALYAIGSGGVFGKGLGESTQKLGFLPEANNDMIFSIICEELGLFGAMAIMLLFLVLFWRCVVIIMNAPDMFGALLVVGVLGHLTIQVILNIAVCTNLFPNTGISLPFISYGGTSVAFLLLEMGIVFNVCRSIRLRDE